MPTPIYDHYISQMTLPDGITYYVKDSEARQWINEIVAGGLTFVIAWDGASVPVPAKIPYGVKVTYLSTEYTGTLVASATTKANIYLVYSHRTAAGVDVYTEYVTVNFGTTEIPSYGWEVLGNTDISLDILGNLAWKDSVTLNKGSGDTVLGEGTTFTAASSAVTFTGDASDTFVKSYPGTTNKLATTSIKGVGNDITFDAVGSATDYTATKVTFGTDTSASVVTTAAKTATNLVLGTNTTASKATAGTALSLAKVAGSATNVSYIGNNNTSSILETATVSGETLTFGSVNVTQGTVTGTNGTETVTPYTFADVTVPVVTSNTTVNFDAVGSLSSVTVPVISSHEDVTTTKVTTSSKTAATSAANSTVVATGKVAASDTNGDDVLVGLGTAVTASAVTDIGTGTAAAQQITVGTNDQVNVAVYGDLSVTVS